MLDQLTDYLIPDDRDQLLNYLAVHIVEGADILVTDALEKGKREKIGREKEREKIITRHISHFFYISYF